MEDDQEIAAFMFRRTVPSTHLTPDDIRWMVMTLWPLYNNNKKKLSSYFPVDFSVDVIS